MLMSPTGRPALSDWNRMNAYSSEWFYKGVWDADKKAWYYLSGSESSDVYTQNYNFAANYVKLPAGHYRLTCDTILKDTDTSNGVRVMLFIKKTADGDFANMFNIYWKTGRHYFEFDITDDAPWVCCRFGTTEYYQTVWVKDMVIQQY